MEMSGGLTDVQSAALKALCDTIVPRVERPEDPTGFWARTASDIGVDLGVAELIAGIPDPALQDGLAQILDALAAQGITQVSQRSREQLLRNLSLASSDAAMGVGALTGMTLFLTYGMPDPETGRNPNWEILGYPGPISAAPPAAKRITPIVPDGATVLDADAVVVGSGAGGGVIAAKLAQAGMKVAIVEAGGYHDESDFHQLELPAYQSMYWRGGPTPTGDQNVAIMAGATLGGGTVVNWTNCLRTKPWVREEWARHGLDYMTDPDYERHFDEVLARISGTTECSDLNGPHQRIREGADKLGLSWHLCTRNTDPATYTPETAAYMGFGDQTGSKQSTLKTYLQDAVDAGADVLVHTSVREVLVENGRAAGVRAVYSDPANGATAEVTVRAPIVVVAAGALESPAILLRSGIGGPATGDYLRLHPALGVVGFYEEDQKAWWGAPQALVCDAFGNLEDGFGFLIEGSQYAPGLIGSSIAWQGGEAYKELVSEVRNASTIISVVRDRGHGRVVLDPASGEGIPFYPVDDPLDRAHILRSLIEITRIHEAAGAQRVLPLCAVPPVWRRGDSIATWEATLARIPLGPGGHKLFAAHQMGTCRMGSDPATSVAKPDGELHDTPGVWIGDASAFPTSSGTNPMLSIMALAHHTAETIVARAGEKAARTSTRPTATATAG